jgi:hypothetical protein
LASKQLWLSVLEGEPDKEWPGTVHDRKWKVALHAADTLQENNQPAPFRTSPVFPATADFVLPDLSGAGVTYFYFLCFDPAFSAIAKILETASIGWKSEMLFTLGLASIVVVSHDPHILETIGTIGGVEPTATEVWEVVAGELVSVNCKCAPQSPVITVRKLPDYRALPLPARTVVDEFVASISLLIPKVAAQMPGEVTTFLELNRLVDELITEMVYAAKPNGAPPETISEYAEADFAGSSLGETIVFQNTDRLVQINAALAYLSTQALSGAVPILERRSLIRRYSLLGVGSATLALTRIARSIERAFAAGAVETILVERGGQAAPLPGLDRLPEYDAAEWAGSSVNRWAGKVAARKPYPKLPYFSGRLGFRETEYTISAALQSLAAGADPEWSLLTVTHEMVHGHVRNILSLLFQGSPSQAPEQKWQEFYERFEQKLAGTGPQGESFLDSLRDIVFAYCCLSITHGSLTREPDGWRAPGTREVSYRFLLPNSEVLWSVFEAESRNISEVLVHVLDLHYFYLSSLSAYVPLVWRSWAKLPQVKGDLRQYLLRSLLVVSTKSKGTSYERFREARARLRELLETASPNATTGRATIEAAIQTLRDDVESEKLFYSFSASLLLVDLANHILTSNTIRGALFGGDAHLEIRNHESSFEDWLDYTLPDGFVDDVVVAPAAYIADRMAKRLESVDSVPLELETVRMFLACSSHIHNEVGQ